MPAKKFTHVHIDLVGPLPASARGHVHTMIDGTSRWPEATPLTGNSAEQCADAFVDSWVTRFGVPEVVTTDRGTQFSSGTWA
jgi:Integrase core domain